MTDGSYFWIASEHIGQTCTLAQFVNRGFSCNGTRTSYANRGTRITQLFQ